MFMMCMTIAAVILFLMRPNSLRRRNDGLNKSLGDVSIQKKPNLMSYLHLQIVG